MNHNSSCIMQNEEWESRVQPLKFYLIMLMAYPRDGYFQQDNVPCHGARNMQISETWGSFYLAQVAHTIIRSERTKLTEPPGRSVCNHQISHNWAMLFVRLGIRFPKDVSTSCLINTKKNHRSIKGKMWPNCNGKL